MLKKLISKLCQETNFIILLMAIISILGLTPLFIDQFLRTTKDAFFSFAHNYMLDYYQYISWMKDGADGKILITSRFSPDEFIRKPVYLFYPIAGFVVSKLGINLFFGYTIWRIFLGLTSLFFIYFFIANIFKKSFERKLAFFLALFLPPFYMINSLRSFFPNITTLDPLKRTFFIPHNLATTIFLLTASVFFNQGLNTKKVKPVIISCLFLFFASLTNPVMLVVYYLFFSLAIFLTFTSFARRLKTPRAAGIAFGDARPRCPKDSSDGEEITANFTSEESLRATIRGGYQESAKLVTSLNQKGCLEHRAAGAPSRKAMAACDKAFSPSRSLAMAKHGGDARLILYSFLALLAGLPLIFYYHRLFTTTLPFSWMFNQQKAMTLNVNLKDFALGLGPAAFLFPFAIPAFFKRKDFLSKLVISWAILPFFLLLFLGKTIPLSQERVFEMSCFIPLSILAAATISRLLKKVRAEKMLLFRTFAILCFFIFSIPYFYLSLKTQIEMFSFPYFNIFIPKSTIAAFNWLDKNTADESIVATGFYTGNMLPAFSHNKVLFGHDFVTYKASKRLNESLTIFSNQSSEEQIEAILRRSKISYILLTPETPKFKETNLPKLDSLQLVFFNEENVIYKTGF